MSEDSRFDSNPYVQPFETYNSQHFHVEWTEKGDDIIYHFWPPEEKGTFLEGFHMFLHDAFEKTCPQMRCYANHTNIREATVKLAHGAGAVPMKDADREIVFPRENYYVRVYDGMKNPLANVFLKHRLFKAIEAEIQENL